MQSVIKLRDGAVAGEHYGRVDRPIDVLFAHANGMNAAAYRGIFKTLPDDIHVLAIDQRGHGLSSLPGDRPAEQREGWTDLRDDLLAVLASLDERPLVLAGHSMGATVGLMAAAAGRHVADRLLLFDPVWTSFAAAEDMAAGSRKRRRSFANRQEAFTWLHGRGVFASWPHQALLDYVSTGLRQVRGAFELSCTPEWETSNFLTSVNPIEACLASLAIPATVLVAETGSAWRPPTRQWLPAEMTVIPVAGATHFLPIEKPQLARDTIVATVAAARRARGD